MLAARLVACAFGPSYRAAPRFTTRERAETDRASAGARRFLPRAGCSIESLTPLSIRRGPATPKKGRHAQRRIRDRFVRKPREGPPRPRSKAPSIEASFFSTADRSPMPRSPPTFPWTRASWERAVVLPPRSRFPASFDRDVRTACWAERATST